MATYYTTDNAPVTVTPEDGHKFTLEEAQRYVGGYVERLHLKNGKVMLMNEDGKLLHLPINRDASVLAAFAHAITAHDFIVGNVIVCHEANFDIEIKKIPFFSQNCCLFRK